MVISLTYFLLAISDYYTTSALLASSKAHEANPLMKFIIDKCGLNCTLYLQIFSWILFTTAFIFYSSELPLEVFFIILLMKALVVANNSVNAWVILRHGS